MDLSLSSMAGIAIAGNSKCGSSTLSCLDLSTNSLNNLSMNSNSVFSGLNNPMFAADINQFSIHALSRLAFPAQLFFNPPPSSTATSTSTSSSTVIRHKSSDTSSSSTKLDIWDNASPNETQETNPGDLCNESSCSEDMGDGSSNASFRRTHKRPIPSEQKDVKYFERRRRNNMAAKKSRDARKNREDQLAVRVAELEKENAILRAHVAFFNEELQMLQVCLVQKSSGTFMPGKQLLNLASRPLTFSMPEILQNANN